MEGGVCVQMGAAGSCCVPAAMSEDGVERRVADQGTRRAARREKIALGALLTFFCSGHSPHFPSAVFTTQQPSREPT